MVAEDRLAALYEVTIRLGLRQGEALGLRWRDIDLTRGVLSVRHQLLREAGAPVLGPPKTDRSRRTIILPEFLVTTLAAHRERQQAERETAGDRWWQTREWDLVFCSRRGAPLNAQRLSLHLRSALDTAGLDRRRWHDLRHTAVTLMLSAGVPERVIMEIMGHSHLDMTRHYGHVLPAVRMDALARVDTLLSPEMNR